MKKLSIVLFVGGLLLLVALLGRLPQVSEAAPAQQTNLLANPGFERPYNNGAANGWYRWHQDLLPKAENCNGTYLFRPHWTEETNTDLIHEGFISQHVGMQFDTWHAGVMQDVAVTPGSRYRFSFWARGRASNEQYPVPSDTGVNLGVQARIDPNGGGVWNAAGIVGGGTGSPHDTWQQFTVEATAVGNKITVFVAANLGGANQCRAHLDVWFDNASLVEVGPPPTNTPPPQPTSPPPPPVTNTPVPPTATATPEVTPTDTPIPTDTPTNTPEPPTGGTICLNAFADDNANGMRDNTEGYMAGVAFTIAQGDRAVAQGLSPGIATPFCVEELEPGEYQVAQQVSGARELTTAANTVITVNEGETVGVEFGSRFRPQNEEEPDAVSNNPTPASDEPAGEEPVASPADEDEGGFNLLAVSGLVAIVVAIGLLGGLIFMLLRQPR